MSKNLIIAVLLAALGAALYFAVGTKGGGASASNEIIESPQDVPAPNQPANDQIDLSAMDRLLLPSSNRVAGIEDVWLGEDVDSWIESIPLERRAEVIRFVNSYPGAYTIESREQLAWMMRHGFPSLEEVAAFDYVSHTAGCDQIRCSNGKVASLAADATLNDLDEYLSTAFPSGPRDIGALPDEFRGDVIRTMARANDYIARARQHGSPLFAAYLSSRLASMTGDRAGREASQAFLAACGDLRARPSSDDTTDIVRRTLLSTTGGMTSCGLGPGRPPFPR